MTSNDFFQLDTDHIAFLVADVSGKGVPASLFAMANQALIRGLASGVKHFHRRTAKQDQRQVLRKQRQLHVYHHIFGHPERHLR